MRKYFEGKSALITGGSSGIGRSLAIQLARMGCDVGIVARGQAALDQTMVALEAAKQHSGQRFACASLDITDRAEVERIAAEMEQKLGRIDLLFNNAGVAYCDYFEQTTPEIFEKMMQVNYFGTVWMTRAILSGMLKRGGGHLVNVTSLVGVLPIVGYTAYAASKFAVMGFTDALRNELAASPIHFSLVLPPDTDTPQYIEENKTKPPETKRVAGKASLMSADAVAALTLRGVAAKRYHIVPGKLDAKLPYVAAHLAPRLVRWVIDREVRSYKKSLEKGEKKEG